MSTCPKCGCQIMDPFQGTVQIHDIEKCRGAASKPLATSTRGAETMSEINGIKSGPVKCIGCGQEFEDFWFVSVGADPMPVCPQCEATMEPI